MIHQSHLLVANGTLLDSYLSKGYYRMGKHIFTTDTIYNNDTVYNVYWLRYNLEKWALSESHNKLLKHLSKFDTVIKSFGIDEDYRALYKKYYDHANFDASASLENYLYNYDEFPGVQLFQFESYAIQIMLNKELIATGIFDNGSESIAGIINFFDPDFKKYSLGKLLVLLKLHFALQQNKKWYYPGYIVPGNSKFDYKTFVGIHCIEVYDCKLKEWIEYKNFFIN